MPQAKKEKLEAAILVRLTPTERKIIERAVLLKHGRVVGDLNHFCRTALVKYAVSVIKASKNAGSK